MKNYVVFAFALAIKSLCFVNAQNSTVAFEDFEVEVLEKIRGRLQSDVEMDIIEQDFLNGLIRKYKPKKLLEIGVSKGGSTAIILNAISDFKEAKLFSIDKEKMCYNFASKETGFVVEERFPELSSKWEKHTGGIAAEFIEKIGKDIDFAFLDTTHAIPGEMLEFLVILPFLKENAVVVFHDTGMHHFVDKRRFYCNNLLLTYVKGKKMVPQRKNVKGVFYDTFYNIGAVELDSSQNNYLFDYFFPLSFHWEYMLEKTDLEKLDQLLSKYYEVKYVEMFRHSIEANEIKPKKKFRFWNFILGKREL